MSWQHKELGMYYEQQPLQFSSYNFLTVNSPIYYNIGWWRFNEDHNKQRLNFLNTKNDCVYFNQEPAICFHAHVLKDLDYQNFGNFLVSHIFDLMKSCNNEKYQALLEKYDELKKSVSN